MGLNAILNPVPCRSCRLPLAYFLVIGWRRPDGRLHRCRP